jgi:hypothetical protein
MKHVPARLGAALVIFALAACGGGGDGKDATAKKPAVQQGKVGTDFRAEADRLCVERADGVAKAARWLPEGDAESFQQLVDLIPVHRRFVTSLRELEPDAQDRERFGEYVTMREELLDALEAEQDAHTAASAGQADIVELQEESSRLEEDSEELARDLGLKACASILPGADEAEITAAITKLWVNPERSDCTDLKSSEALERIFDGDLSACETGIFEVLSDSVKISLLQGVGKFAWADYTLVGGDHDGAKFTSVFFKEDGAWREDYTQAVSAEQAQPAAEEATEVTKEQYIFVADSICARNQEEGYAVLEALVESGLQEDGEAVQAALGKLFDGTAAAIAEIRTLPLPAGEETMIRGFLSNAELGISEVRQEIATPDGALVLFSADEGPFADLHEDMHQYGFWQCAGQDPDE